MSKEWHPKSDWWGFKPESKGEAIVNGLFAFVFLLAIVWGTFVVYLAIVFGGLSCR